MQVIGWNGNSLEPSVQRKGQVIKQVSCTRFIQKSMWSFGYSSVWVESHMCKIKTQLWIES